MKASEVITELTKLIEQYGDREIVYDYGCPIEGFDPEYGHTLLGRSELKNHVEYDKDYFNVIG